MGESGSNFGNPWKIGVAEEAQIADAFPIQGELTADLQQQPGHRFAYQGFLSDSREANA